MLKRKPLIVALAAAGLLAADGLPEAFSEDVFVPELALLDGGACGGAIPLARSPLLLQLAQAKPTEVSLAGAAAAAASVASTETERPLIPDLGKRSFRISTSSRL